MYKHFEKAPNQICFDSEEKQNRNNYFLFRYFSISESCVQLLFSFGSAKLYKKKYEYLLSCTVSSLFTHIG